MAGQITLEMVMAGFAETHKIFHRGPYIPDPCDVHPELWEALKKRCVMIEEGSPLNWIRFGGIRIHVRTDVPNWALNVCTCGEKHGD
jgi:hypothetical protein